MEPNNGYDQKKLLETGQVQEQPFSSNVPIIGPIIIFIRNSWNSIAAKWYVRPLLQQQNEFNSLILQRLRYIDDRLQDHEQRLIEDDRDRVGMIREVAEINLQLADINKLIDQLENRLDKLETETGIKEPED